MGARMDYVFIAYDEIKSYDHQRRIDFKSPKAIVKRTKIPLALETHPTESNPFYDAAGWLRRELNEKLILTTRGWKKKWFLRGKWELNIYFELDDATCEDAREIDDQIKHYNRIFCWFTHQH